MSSSGEDRPLRPVPRHRYVDFQVAGEGAMGLVYLALDTELNRNVAFKIVRPDGPGDGSGETLTTPLDASAPTQEAALDARFVELKARFLQEAWVTGGMEHPGIVPVYELGRTEGGVPYYTMRFVRGRRTLETAIEELRLRAIEERLTVIEPFLKLCDAVSYAHAKGVIHRDLKPANVALGEFGEVVLLDWGLAKLRDQGGAPGEEPAAPARQRKDFHTDEGGLGTPGYMPPEAVRGAVGDLDDRSDVYSLGVILFQILTSQLPFPVDPFPEYYDRVIREEPPSAKSVNTAVPDALDQVCAQALRRDRDERLESVRALADGVRHWQTQSALDREMEGLLRDAETALSAADDARGPSRIRQTQRAMEVLATARRHQPDSERLRGLQTQARALRNRGIKETQSRSRRRILLLGGVTLLVLVSIAAFVVAGLLNERRQEAEEANRATAAALDEVSKQRETARLESQAALLAKKEAEKKTEEANEAYKRVSALVALVEGDAEGVFTLIERARDAERFAHAARGVAMQGVAVPSALDEREQIARRGTAEKRSVLDEARRRGERREVTPARVQLVAAQEEHARVLDDILRALEERIDAPLREMATLEQVRATLGPADVFISYGRVEDVAVAVVVQPDTQWAITLDKQGLIDEAVSGLLVALVERRDIAEPLKALRQLIVEPLALPPTQGRAYIAPHGATLLVPFALIASGREVRIAPSARVYLHMRETAPPPGEGVLAIADAISRGDSRLWGARAEAEAVGTSTLLRGDATWTKLAASLASRARWRAVHVGCRGHLVRESRNRVGLELTPEDVDDGILTPREIARLDCRSDLLVLSTASTRRSPGELDVPTLELPQAFLFAGARSVLFPTFPTDDSSTRALMTRFYELWHPKDGAPGLDAATALQRAQTFVRGHKKWRHPHYWAAWVLWGMP